MDNNKRKCEETKNGEYFDNGEGEKEDDKKEDKINLPNEKYPIVQSYVDIFLNGCFQIQDKFKINEFSDLCVQTTTGWSKSWVNDRVHARRPFLISNFNRIDSLLGRNFSYYFDNKIE